jgi:hypothetical protein
VSSKRVDEYVDDITVLNESITKIFNRAYLTHLYQDSLNYKALQEMLFIMQDVPHRFFQLMKILSEEIIFREFFIVFHFFDICSRCKSAGECLRAEVIISLVEGHKRPTVTRHIADSSIIEYVQRLDVTMEEFLFSVQVAQILNCEYKAFPELFAFFYSAKLFESKSSSVEVD